MSMIAVDSLAFSATYLKLNFVKDTISLQSTFLVFKINFSISSPHFDVCAGTNISTSKYIRRDIDKF